MARPIQKFFGISLHSAILAATVLTGTQAAQAASILYETRAITNGVNDWSYRMSWHQQTSAITSNYISDFNGTTPGENSFAHLKIEFAVNPVQDILFQIAPDAGFGGERIGIARQP